MSQTDPLLFEKNSLLHAKYLGVLLRDAAFTLHAFRQNLIVFANFATNSYMYRKRAYGAPVWPQSVGLLANVFYCKSLCRLYSLIQFFIISVICLLLDFKLRNVNLGTISLDQIMLAVNFKCFCTISLS